MAKNEVRVYVKEIATGKVTAYATQRSACIALGLNVRSQLRNGQIVGKKYKIGREAITKRVIKSVKKNSEIPAEKFYEAWDWATKKYGKDYMNKLTKAMMEFVR